MISSGMSLAPFKRRLPKQRCQGDLKCHRFAVNGDEERRPFAFAGIWRRSKGPVKKDGPNVELDAYSFTTTAPNALTDSNQSRADAGAAE